jgi:hypothetical protein
MELANITLLVPTLLVNSGTHGLTLSRLQKQTKKNKQDVVRETKLSRRGKQNKKNTALKISKKYRSSFWKKGDQKQGKALRTDESKLIGRERL